MKVINGKYLSILICILSSVSICSGQINSTDTILKRRLSLYFVIKVNNSNKIFTRDLLLETRLMDHITQLSKKEVKEKYNDVKADYAFLVTLKPGVKFISLNQIFDRYKVDKLYRNYPVLVDRKETEDAKSLIANEGYIEKVIVNKEQRYIEIITRSYKSSMEHKKSLREKRQYIIN